MSRVALVLWIIAALYFVDLVTVVYVPPWPVPLLLGAVFAAALARPLGVDEALEALESLGRGGEAYAAGDSYAPSESEEELPTWDERKRVWKEVMSIKDDMEVVRRIMKNLVAMGGWVDEEGRLWLPVDPEKGEYQVYPNPVKELDSFMRRAILFRFELMRRYPALKRDFYQSRD